MRQFLAIFAAFTIGALASEVKNQRTIADLRVEVDSAYHEGMRDSIRNPASSSQK